MSKNLFYNTEMVKYTYKTVAYVLPESIKRMNNDVRLNRAQGEKERIKNELNNVDNELNDIDNQIKNAKTKNEKIQLENKKKQFEKTKEDLKNKFTNINNNIFDIKAELYGSMVNLNNNNINKLSANINDISSFIKGNKDFTEDIKDNISKILASQVNIKSIFEGVNLKDMLEDILLKVDNNTKSKFPDKINKIKEFIDSINLNPGENEENLKKWNEFKEYFAELVPTEKIIETSDIYNKRILEIEDIKSELTKFIFGKVSKDVPIPKIKEYLQKINSLNDLYDLTEKVLKNVPLYNARDEIDENKNNKIRRFEIMNKEFINDRYDMTIEIFKDLINKLRKWFYKTYVPFNKIPEDGIVINNTMKDKELLKFKDIKDVKLEDIKDVMNKIELIKKYMEKSHMKNYYISQGFTKMFDTQTNNSEENVSESSNQIIIQDLNQNEDENSNQNENQKQKKIAKKTVRKRKGEGLDLDEIHQMNVMNDISTNYVRIIDYMDNINETLKEIKKSLSNQNSQSKQNPQKLGRFKVEKYNPNMSITEFKKLFDKK